MIEHVNGLPPGVSFGCDILRECFVHVAAYNDPVSEWARIWFFIHPAVFWVNGLFIQQLMTVL
jgi:hypothetical protein